MLKMIYPKYYRKYFESNIDISSMLNNQLITNVTRMLKKLAQLPTCKKCVGQIWRGGSSKAKVQS